MIESEPVHAAPVRRTYPLVMDTAIEIPRAQRSASARASEQSFAAGTGVMAALIAAAVVTFASIAAFVAFNGMPFGSGDTPESAVTVSGAPKAAALAAGSTAEAVAADPATPSGGALAEIVAALPPSFGAGADPGAGGTGSGAPGVDDTFGSGGGTSGPVDVPGNPAPGPVQGAVGAVDDATGGLGLDLGLGETTNGITQGLDDTIGATLNNVGNGLGAGNLGDKANNTLGGVTNGPNGLNGLLD